MSRHIYSLWLLICMFVCVPAQGFNDTIDRLAEYTHIILATFFGIILLKQKYMNR